MASKIYPAPTSNNLSDYTGTVSQLNNFLEENPETFPVMFREMLHNPDARVRLRMGNAVEKAARKTPALLIPYKKEILSATSQRQENEIIWHIALLLGYLELEEDDLALAVNALFNWLHTLPHKFVKVNCLQTLAVLARQHDWLQPEVREALHAALEHESAAIRARARILLKTFKATKKR
ncbi:hypothetical protein I5M27_01395 [Adhaeribacter sp. BT258]|uniref:HEAT repeat domain-containing protein n=1 Tax=Adhaeribacter terrigena TaxID=2793070 RepID=A0ABS1BX75_9BACT|nr:hypothetical protein [Adhaeribacter terrigena]MBK0401618.1 hypothetical protein [Adhaeribacter terrigena]